MLPFVKQMIDDRLSLLLLAVVLETDPQKVKAIVPAWKSLQLYILSLPNSTEILRVFKNSIRKFIQHMTQKNPIKYFSSYRRHYMNTYNLAIEPILNEKIHLENLEYLVPQNVFTTSVYGMRYIKALQSKITFVSKYQKQLRKYLQGYQQTSPSIVQGMDDVALSFRKFEECIRDISRIQKETELVRIDETLRNQTETSLKNVVLNDNRNFVKLVYEMNNFVFNTEQILYCLYNFGHTYAPDESGAIMMQTIYQLYQPYLEKLFEFISTTQLTGLSYAIQFLKLYKPIDELTYYMHRSPDVEKMKKYNIQVSPQNSFPVCFTKKDRSTQVAQSCRRQQQGNFSNCYKQKTAQTKLQTARSCLIQQNLDPACAKIIGNSNGFYFLQIVQNLTRMKLLLNDFIKYLSKTEFDDNEKKKVFIICRLLHQYSEDVYIHSPLPVKTIRECQEGMQQKKQQQIGKTIQKTEQIVQQKKQMPFNQTRQQQSQRLQQPVIQKKKQTDAQVLKEEPIIQLPKQSQLERVFARMGKKPLEQFPSKKTFKQQIPISSGKVKQLIKLFEK